jgi:hypothetical protein
MFFRARAGGAAASAAPPSVTTGTCDAVDERGTGVALRLLPGRRRMIFRALLYLVLMLGLAARERIVGAR